MPFETSLKDYNGSVYSLISFSNKRDIKLFHEKKRLAVYVFQDESII